MDKPQYITMKDPEELKMHCISKSKTIKPKYFGGYFGHSDWDSDPEITVKYIDEDLIVRKMQKRISRITDILVNTKYKYSTTPYVRFTVNKGSMYHYVNINKEYRDILHYQSNSSLGSALAEALKYTGVDTPFSRVVDIANDIIHINLKYRDMAVVNQGNYHESFNATPVSKLPIQNIIWVDKIDISRYNDNDKYFDFVNVEFYMIAAVKKRKEFIKKNMKYLLQTAEYKLCNDKRFTKYGVPFNFLKLDRIHITRDSAVIFTYSLKELKENDNNAQE